MSGNKFSCFDRHRRVGRFSDLFRRGTGGFRLWANKPSMQSLCAECQREKMPRSDLSRLLKTLIPGCSKRSRCEAREKSTSGGVFTDTLERGDRAQRSRWAFFNSLLTYDIRTARMLKMPS